MPKKEKTKKPKKMKNTAALIELSDLRLIV